MRTNILVYCATYDDPDTAFMKKMGKKTGFGLGSENVTVKYLS